MIYLTTFIALTLLAGVGGLAAVQEKIIFPGTPLEPDHNFLDEPHLYEVNLDRGDAIINALHYRLPSPRGLIFFLHGNAGNLESWLPDVNFYRQENYDLFMLDYRGYGKSGGQIQSQAQLEADVMAAWDSVAQYYQSKSLPTVIYGRSLGTYLATYLSLQVDADLLVLVSPYTSMTAMARQKFPFMPTTLLRYPLATDQIFNQVSAPVLILHGSDDRLIPVSHAELLKQNHSIAELTVIDGAGHADIHNHPDYINVLRNALP